MFNEIDWLKKYKSYGEFSLAKISSILIFSYIWNLFEKDVCNKNAQIRNVSQYIDPLVYIDKRSEVIDDLWSYFKNRYTDKSNVSDKFESFVFNDDCIKEKVKESLLNNCATTTEKMETMLRIVFRLRNNLFHGEKDITKLYEQNELFYKANHLLTIVLDLNSHK